MAWSWFSSDWQNKRSHNDKRQDEIKYTFANQIK